MIRVRHPPTYEPERRYVLGVLLGERLGLDFEAEPADRPDVELSLDGRSLVLPDVLFATAERDWLTPASLPQGPLERLDGPPVVYGTAADPDLLGSSFFMLTRYEEAVRTERDDHGRFPVTASLAHEEGFLDRPIVDEYAALLSQRLERLSPRLEPRRRPAFTVLPSHDVDWPRCPEPRLRSAAGDALGRRDPDLALRRLVLGPRLCDTFDLIMDASERRGLRSAFYFLPGPPDAAYSLDDPPIRRLLRRIAERGHEIGVHASYDSFRDPERTRADADALRTTCEQLGLGQPVLGGRQHFLRWENPTTWQNWEDAGLAYDSSLTFTGRPGFRCGTCFEYPVFNLRTRRQLRLRERPLVAMEVSVLYHLQLAGEQALAELCRLKERCRQAGGAFTLLWHNNWLVSRRQRRLYEQVLDA